VTLFLRAFSVGCAVEALFIELFAECEGVVSTTNERIGFAWTDAAGTSRIARSCGVVKGNMESSSLYAGNVCRLSIPRIGVAEHVARRFDNTPNLVLEFPQRFTQRMARNPT